MIPVSRPVTSRTERQEILDWVHWRAVQNVINGKLQRFRRPWELLFEMR